MIVFFNADVNLSSANICVKLLRPTNFIALLPSHSAKDMSRARIIGPRVNIANPIKFGAINE